jgi:hypothetical protein
MARQTPCHRDCATAWDRPEGPHARMVANKQISDEGRLTATARAMGCPSSQRL